MTDAIEKWKKRVASLPPLHIVDKVRAGARKKRKRKERKKKKLTKPRKGDIKWKTRELPAPPPFAGPRPTTRKQMERMRKREMFKKAFKTPEPPKRERLPRQSMKDYVPTLPTGHNFGDVNRSREYECLFHGKNFRWKEGKDGEIGCLEGCKYLVCM